MTRVVVTGSHGFVGQRLVQRLLARGLGGRPVESIVAIDIEHDNADADVRLRSLVGNLGDPVTRAGVCEAPVDVFFHLASVPGGSAERQYDVGRRVNLDATLGLLESLSAQKTPARFIYASSIAVYGDQLPERMDESAPTRPALTYGAHKLACEIMVADATRRGWIEGCSLRLPGVVARPGDGAGMMSAFMSQLFWKAAAAEPLVLPVSPQGTAWWISVERCVDNLVHAAVLPEARFTIARSYQMPVLHLSLETVVAALGERFGQDSVGSFSYAPDPVIQRLFASYPPLSTTAADAIGFLHDGDVQALVQRVFS